MSKVFVLLTENHAYIFFIIISFSRFVFVTSFEDSEIILSKSTIYHDTVGITNLLT